MLKTVQKKYLFTTKKIMKFIYYILFLLPIAGYSQLSISGKVIDKYNAFIPYANIAVKKDSVIIHQTMTDSVGKYSFVLNHNSPFELTFSELNFKQNKIVLQTVKDTVLNVQLEEVSNELNEIVVSSKRKIIERKADRYILNVTNSVSAMGSDAFTLLSKTPGVKGSSKQISLVGKKDVIVTIDDRVLQLSADELVSYLKTIPASDISKIEVITNPSAKYEAQGSSGIINIVLKKSTKKGYSGTVNLSYKQHRYASFNENLSLSYNKDKWNISGNISTSQDKNYIEHSIDTYYPAQTWYLTGNNKEKDKNFNFNFDVLYKLSENTQLSLSALNSNLKSDKFSYYRTDIFDAANQLDSISLTNSDGDKKSRQSSVNFQLKHNFDSKGTALSTEFEWLGRNEDRFQNLLAENYYDWAIVVPDSELQMRSTNTSKINVYTLNSEVKFPLENESELSVGAKFTFINLNTVSEIFDDINNQFFLNVDQSPISDYNENRQAVFSDFKKAIDKWKFQFGVRLEYTQTNGLTETSTSQSFKNDYFQIFPSLNIGYTVNDKNSLNLTYGRRINRPSFRLLNPFRAYTSAYDYWEGNPFLKPSITNNVDFVHNYNDKFTTSFSYSHTKDNFEQITIFQPDNVVSHLAMNYMDSNIFQLMVSTTLNKIKRVETNIQLQGFYKEFLSKISTLDDNSLLGWYFMINNQVELNKAKTITGELNFWYQSSTIDLEATYKDVYNLDLGLKFLLFQKNVSLALNASDLLRSNKERFSTNINNTKQNFYNYWEPRSFRISLQYKFGNRKINYKERDSTSEDVNR